MALTREEYLAYQAFVRDDTTEKALGSSEVFQNYKKISEAADKAMEKISFEESLNEKTKILDAFDAFEQQIRSNPALKAKFLQIKAYLAANPGMLKNVDANFVNGINMLNLGGEDE